MLSIVTTSLTMARVSCHFKITLFWLNKSVLAADRGNQASKYVYKYICVCVMCIKILIIKN